MATVAAKFFLLPRVEHQSSRGNLDLTLARFWFYFVFLLNFLFFTQALIYRVVLVG